MRSPRQATHASKPVGSGMRPASARTPRATAAIRPRRSASSSVTVQTTSSPASAASAGEHLGGDHHGRDAALHVAGAATVQPRAAPRGLVGRRVQSRGVAGRDDVDVAVEQEAGSLATAAGEARRKLRASREVEAGRHLTAAGHHLGAGHPDVDVGAGGAQALGECGLERGLLAAAPPPSCRSR